MRRGLLLALAVLVAVALGGCGRRLSSEQARDLMRRINVARTTACLTGDLTTTVRVGDDLLTAQASLASGPDRSVLTFASGKYARWRIVEQDGLVWRVDPRGQPQPGQGGIGGQSTMAGLGGRRGLTDLVIRQGLPGRLAGRTVQHYEISPLGKSKARLELAVDAETGYPLATTRYGTRGRMLSSTVFHTVTFGVKPPARVPVPAVAQASGPAKSILHTRVATAADLEKALGGPLLRPRQLPEGFSLVGYYLNQTPRGPLAETRYSDGLRVLVLLQSDLRKLKVRPTQALRAETRGLRPDTAPPSGNHEGPGAMWHARAGGDAHRAWRQALRSRLRGHIVRERRGSNFIVIAGDLAPEQLQEVMDGLPAASGQTTHF